VPAGGEGDKLLSMRRIEGLPSGGGSSGVLLETGARGAGGGVPMKGVGGGGAVSAGKGG
jgi:hypothetical protein